MLKKALGEQNIVDYDTNMPKNKKGVNTIIFKNDKDDSTAYDLENALNNLKMNANVGL